MVVMLAAIFIDYPYCDTVGAGSEVSWKPRGPDMRRRFGFDPRLFRRLVASENLFDKWI
jgi:hypothetical protein